MLRSRFLLSCILLLVPLSSVSAQKPLAPSKPHAIGPAKWTPAPQEQYVAYWTLEPGWTTYLEMRNNVLAHDVTVTPVLRAAVGTEFALPAVTLASDEVTSLDLRQAVLSAAPQLIDKVTSFGSVVYRFSAHGAENIFVAAIVQRLGSPVAFHFDGSPIYPEFDQGSIETIWWLPTATSNDYLILSNASAKAVTANLSISDASGKAARQNLALPPAHTLRLDLRDITQAAGLTGQQGGLTVSFAKGAANINASHIVFDETTGLATIMKTFDHDPTEAPRQHTVRAPMMALSTPDPTLGLPAGTSLVPQILLRNTSSAPLTAIITLDWRSAATSGRLPVPLPTLAANEVRVLNLADLAESGQLPADATWATVTVSHQGRSGDVVPVAVSYDGTGRYGLQTPFSEVTSPLWKGSMWHVDAIHNTLIVTGNGDTKPTHAAMTLFYNGGKDSYTIEKPLQPGDQIWADVGQIIRNQVPDKNGATIPVAVMAGSYELRDLDNLALGRLYEGKLVLDKTWGHGYYGCARCCGYRGPSFNPNPFTGNVGGGSPDTLTAPNACTNVNYDLTAYGYNWASDNTGVATVASAYTNLVSPGSANGSSYLDLVYGSGKFCPDQTFYPAALITSNPTVSISGSTNVPLLAPGTQGRDSMTLTANPNPPGGTYSWTIVSGASNVDLLNYTSQSAIVQSKAIGSFTVQVAYTYNNQTATAAAVGIVQQPGSLLVPSGGDTDFVYDFNCRSTAPDYPPYTSGTRRITYRVLDTSGQSVPVAGMSAAESFSPVSNSCVHTAYPSPTTGTTSSDGTFGPDAIGHLCSISCLPADASDHPLGSCSLVVQQTWFVNGFSVQSKNLNLTCQSVTLQ
jgi:hypothetical protein